VAKGRTLRRCRDFDPAARPRAAPRPAPLTADFALRRRSCLTGSNSASQNPPTPSRPLPAGAGSRGLGCRRSAYRGPKQGRETPTPTRGRLLCEEAQADQEGAKRTKRQSAETTPPRNRTMMIRKQCNLISFLPSFKAFFSISILLKCLVQKVGSVAGSATRHDPARTANAPARAARDPTPCRRRQAAANFDLNAQTSHFLIIRLALPKTNRFVSSCIYSLHLLVDGLLRSISSP